MAGTAKYDEIVFDVTSQGTARLNVMDLEILGNPASLTSPAISPQHLPAKPLIGFLVQAEPRMFRDD